MCFEKRKSRPLPSPNPPFGAQSEKGYAHHLPWNFPITRTPCALSRAPIRHFVAPQVKRSSNFCAHGSLRRNHPITCRPPLIQPLALILGVSVRQARRPPAFVLGFSLTSRKSSRQPRACAYLRKVANEGECLPRPDSKRAMADCVVPMRSAISA
jgi:hypothetical protein